MQKRLTLLRTVLATFGAAVLFGSAPRLARADGEFCILPPQGNSATAPFAWQTLNMKVREEAKASLRPLQANAGPQPVNTVGQLNAMIILVDFQDTPAQVPNFEMRNFFFGDIEDSPNGSVTQYYTENSYGKFFLSGQTFGNPRSSPTDHPDPTRQVRWLRMPQTYAYYAAGVSGLTTGPRSAQQLVRDALTAVQQTYTTLDWAQFDGNNDGYLDLLYIVHAGPGAEGTGDPNEIWSHRWSIEDFPVGQGSNGLTIKARDYAMGAEESRVGVHAHEIGHVLGLPDLYTNPQGQSVGIGHWSIMASGSNIPGFEVAADIQGHRPTHFDAWCKIQLGWITPTLVTRNTPNITLPPVQTNPTVLKIPANANNAQEYFLVENRPRLEGTYDAPRLVEFFDTFNQQFDSEIIGGLPGSGVIIYHIDERRGTNDDRGHLLVSVEEADVAEVDPDTGRLKGANLLLPFYHPDFNQGDTGDPFGNANKAFTNKTLPSSLDYTGRDSGVRVEAITAPPQVSADLDKNNRPDPAGLHVVRPANANATLNVRMASIIGAIFAPDASTLPTINVRLLDAARAPIPTANFEKSGTEYSFFDIDPGAYFVEITSNGFIPQILPLEKREGPVILRNFLLPQLQAGSFAAGYNMLTLPLDFNGRKLSEVLNVPGLKSYGWNGTEYVADPVVRSGEGYWVSVTDANQIKVQLPGVSTSGEVTQAIPIRQGWNLIGNPYPRAITWNPAAIQLQVQGGSLITLDQAFEADTAANYGWSWRATTKQYQQIRRGDPVRLYQAFWFYSNVNGSLIIPAPMTPAS